MGTWAEGNFDNDCAGDFVYDIAGTLRAEMKPPEEVEDIDLIMAAVAMLAALVERCRAPAPEIEEIAALKESVLKIYDEQIDGLKPDAEFKEKRRAVIAQTFEDLLAAAKEQK